MDDDIDIEEHDVLDNPRIKSIFPDLSRVKIEIPDEDDIEETYNHMELEPGENSPHEMLYQNEYSFETTTEHVGGEDTQYEEENEYFYNNQIILGSKPPVDPEVLYQEALESHPIVYLENWEDRLKTSPCFCGTCSILFPTVNALDAHKMISHSYLVALDSPMKNTARKSTVPSKYCNHCSKTFPDDTSLIKHLYELLPLNNFPKVKEETIEPEMNKKVPTTVLPWPKKVKTTSHVITKVHPKKNNIEKNKKIEPKMEVEAKSKLDTRYKKDGKFFAASSLVPKSTLFQCNICQIGFLSCFSALQHSRTCEKSAPFEKCGVCKRKIRPKDAKTHRLQHSHNDKLKIYTLSKNLYEKILCKCPKCLACFDELGFWAHYQKCKRDRKTTYCPDCEMHIATIRYQNHKAKHSTKKLSKKDFILIEFYDENLKMTTNKDVARVQKQIKKQKITDNEINLYFCEHCGCYQYKLCYKGHRNGKCKIKIGMHKKYCDKCGLCFSVKSISNHLNLHKKYSFTLQEIKIYSLTTGKEISPPLPDLHKCKQCSKHFLYRRHKQLHTCKTEKFTTCKICTKKFNLQAYKIHKLYHPTDKLIPELLKKYHSIQTTWNIMFMCSTCRLTTMTYDSAITHSQGHLNYVISDFPTVCTVCDVRIASKEFPLHEKLHANNESINRSSFTILRYNYEDLFKNEWFRMFEGLTKQDRHQILSKSIYRYTRSIKMHIEVNASTDDYKYFCMNCNSFIKGPDICTHIHTKCVKTNKYVCSICQEVFKTLKQFLTHGTHEENMKNYTIVTFNNECDKDFNNHLSVLNENSNKMYKIYKCGKCDTCVNLPNNMERHNCIPKSWQWFCDICEQFFSAKGKPLHMTGHKKRPGFVKDKLSIIMFNEASQSTDKDNGAVAKIFQCGCGLHFTSLRTIDRHLDECTPNLTVSKEICSKCNLLFPTDVLVTHLVNHHSKDMPFKIEKCFRTKLWKCRQCEVHFLNRSSINDHYEDCDPGKGVQCTACKLSFTPKGLTKHMCSNKDIKYLNKITILDKEACSITVYKCVKCDICYLRRNSFMYHYSDVNHRLYKPPSPCRHCGLKFTNCSLQKHLKTHKMPNSEFEIKVLNPISGEFTILTGKNKVIDDGDVDVTRSSPRKRKLEALEDSALIKKERLSPVDKGYKTPERKSLRRKANNNPSTSKDEEVDMVADISDSNITEELASEKTGISKKLKSRILVNGYSNNLYKCVSCNQHYMKEASFDYHAKNHRLQDTTDNYECDVCHLEFSRYTLPRHKYVHHYNMALKREDFVILTETPNSKEQEILDRIESLKKAKYVPKKSQNLIKTLNINDDTSQTSNENYNNVEQTGNTEKIVYYKCSDCNVCFINQDMCLSHTKSHEAIDPKMYIECKLCNFQFLIDSLKEHMVLHHNVDFKIENLTIHEYEATDSGLDPKIDIYQAVDKVQSRLVSTTTDVGII